jgi:uncharacterized protein (TIGR04552 family)
MLADDKPPRGRPRLADAGAEMPLAKLADLAALRLILTGESTVDWPRLWLPDRDAVDSFLRLCAFDTDNPVDLGRIRELHRDAVDYLRDVHHLRLLPALEEPANVHEVFLAASLAQGRSRRQACILLKVMHILHHLAGRELLFNTPISEAQLLDRLSAKVFQVIDRMRASGVGVVEFAAGQKTRTSLVSKLLAKRSTLASQVFDRLRFRIVVQKREDIVLTLLYLSRHLFAFNYVIPEQSQNGIVDAPLVARILELPQGLVTRFWEEQRSGAGANEFSGASYRSINFVVDIPLRIDDVAPEHAPAVTFAQTEIQVVDSETARANSRGENSHTLYKKRQRERVRERLDGPEMALLDKAWLDSLDDDGSDEPQGA